MIDLDLDNFKCHQITIDENRGKYLWQDEIIYMIKSRKELNFVILAPHETGKSIFCKRVVDTLIEEENRYLPFKEKDIKRKSILYYTSNREIRERFKWSNSILKKIDAQDKDNFINIDGKMILLPKDRNELIQFMRGDNELDLIIIDDADSLPNEVLLELEYLAMCDDTILVLVGNNGVRQHVSGEKNLFDYFINSPYFKTVIVNKTETIKKPVIEEEKEEKKSEYTISDLIRDVENIYKEQYKKNKKENETPQRTPKKFPTYKPEFYDAPFYDPFGIGGPVWL